MADKRKTDPDKTGTTEQPDTDRDRKTADADETRPSDLGPPADAEKTEDGYVYPESGSFVVEEHKGDTATPVTSGPGEDDAATRRKATTRQSKDDTPPAGRKRG
jgi:hypothetical protein